MSDLASTPADMPSKGKSDMASSTPVKLWTRGRKDRSGEQPGAEAADERKK
jgi:hypothetical protein